MLTFTRITSTEFDEEVRTFVGQRITRAWRGYGSALFLEVGPLTLIYEDSGKPKAEKGLHVGSNWTMQCGESVLAAIDANDTEFERVMQDLTGSTIASIVLRGDPPELSLAVSPAKSFRSAPNEEGEPEWAIFLPNRFCIGVRSGELVREINRPEARH